MQERPENLQVAMLTNRTHALTTLHTGALQQPHKNRLSLIIPMVCQAECINTMLMAQ